MAEYWRAALGQEGADYEMTVTDGSFELRVKRCPPTEWFKANNLAKYPRYCEHCRVLYSRIGDRCGFAMEYFPPDDSRGTCCGFRFVKKQKPAAKNTRPHKKGGVNNHEQNTHARTSKK
jgi:hypothetical protein